VLPTALVQDVYSKICTLLLPLADDKVEVKVEKRQGNHTTLPKPTSYFRIRSEVAINSHFSLHAIV